MLIDTHAHLTDERFDDERGVILARARERGVSAVIDVGDSLTSSLRCLKNAGRYKNVYAAVGIHPHNAGNADEPAAERIAGLAGAPGVVAVGETGLDFYRDLAPRERQERMFRKMAAIALDRSLPLIVHCRAAYPVLIEILAELRGDGLRAVVHCFSGSAEDASAIIELGYYISVGGPLTYPRNEALRETFRQLPLERIMLETDCPYLPPQPRRGRRNEPANLVFVAEELARLRGLSLEETAAATTANAERFFPGVVSGRSR